jgi:hypothetical protein
VDVYSYPLQETEFFRNQKKEKGMSIKFNQRNLKLVIAAGILLGFAGFSTAVYYTIIYYADALFRHASV